MKNELNKKGQMELNINMDEYERAIISNIAQTGRIHEEDMPVVMSMMNRIGDEINVQDGEPHYADVAHSVTIPIEETRQWLDSLRENPGLQSDISRTLDMFINKYGPSDTITYIAFWIEAFKAKTPMMPEVIDCLAVAGRKYGLTMAINDKAKARETEGEGAV